MDSNTMQEHLQPILSSVATVEGMIERQFFLRKVFLFLVSYTGYRILPFVFPTIFWWNETLVECSVRPFVPYGGSVAV